MSQSKTAYRKQKTRDLCDKYQVSPVTIWRWTQSGVLPKPQKINGYNYWDYDVQPKVDEEVA